jgi:hypothetical protein
MRILLIILAVCLVVWIELSPFIWIYYTFNPRKRPSRGKKLEFFILVGTFIGLFCLLGTGFDAGLFFIPSSWGGLEEHVTMRHSLAGTLAFFASIFILWLLNKQKILSRENEALRKEIDERKERDRWK